MKICKDLNEVRSEIDRLDDAIVRLIAERADFVKQAAAFKKDADAVKAKGRVEAVIMKIREKAAQAGLNPDLAEKVYRVMIEGFIEEEMREWKSGKE